MKKITASDLKERVKFLKRKVTLNSVGDYEEEWIEGEERWAMIKPLSSFKSGQQAEWHNVPCSKAKNLYKITMRKNVIRNALHADQEALIWKGKILNTLFPFRPTFMGDLIEAIFVDYGEGKNDG
jgi:head-tail adaptor